MSNPHPGLCGARFVFGGKFVSLEKKKTDANPCYIVKLSQVALDSKLVSEARAFQHAIDGNEISDICEKRALVSAHHPSQLVWTFLCARSQECKRSEYCKILGFDPAKEQEYFVSLFGPTYANVRTDFPLIGDSDSGEDEDEGEEGQLPAIDSKGDYDISALPVNILNLPSSENHLDANIIRSLITGDVAAACFSCMERGLWTQAAQLAVCGSRKLHRIFLDRYLAEKDVSEDATKRLICYLSSCRFKQLIDTWHLSDWKRLLCLLLLTIPSLVDTSDKRETDLFALFARRLLNNGYREAASLVSLFSRPNANLFVQLITSARSVGVADLQRIVEQTTIFRWIAGGGSIRTTRSTPEFLPYLRNFALYLSSQGCLDIAWRLTNTITDPSDDKQLNELKDRLYWACGSQAVTKVSPPNRPFTVQKVTNPWSVQDFYGTANYYQPSYHSMTGNQSAAISSIAKYRHTAPSPLKLYSTPINKMLPNYGEALNYASQRPWPVGYSQQNTAVPQNYQNMPGPLYSYTAPATDALSGERFPREMSHAEQKSPSSGSGFIPSGWNDPPPLTNRRPSAPKTADIPPAITCPISGHILTSNHTLSPPATGGQPTSVANGAVNYNEPIDETLENEPIAKAFLPILNTLNRLAELCARANIPLVRKRADDARQQMQRELVPRLRQKTLSTTTIENLFRLSECVGQSDFEGALAVHVLMVRGPGFSEISPFMPSIRTLLQSAIQANLHYQ